uniref:Uncharacterized protein n=1 Tax=Ixodes ricinus TaxID=34613 RepID=A0A6B0TRP0_IXORI
MRSESLKIVMCCLFALRIGGKRIRYFPQLTPQSGNLCWVTSAFPSSIFPSLALKTKAFTKPVSPRETAG